ncbi:hypothetical protein SRHO_G00158950 [Serrasalmus rhombeus]
MSIRGYRKAQKLSAKDALQHETAHPHQLTAGFGFSFQAPPPRQRLRQSGAEKSAPALPLAGARATPRLD